MRRALVAALLLAPTVLLAPPRGPELVTVRVGHEQATGFVAGDGRVMTVAHVLGSAPVSVHGRLVSVDGRPASVLRVDQRLDLAWLRVPGVRGDAARLGGGGEVRVRGRPAPIVRRIRASVDGGPRRPAFEIRAAVASGDSGAPLVTPTGRVAGVVFARSRTRPGIAYAVALDRPPR